MKHIPDSRETVNCHVPAQLLVSEKKVSLVPLERCITADLLAVWEAGVETVCSCCGHGNDDRAYIRVEASSADKMRELGYEPYQEIHECMIHPGSVAFKAKHVSEERSKPCDTHADPEEVRSWWRKGAHMEGVVI